METRGFDPAALLRFRESLLAPTIANALRTDFYSKHWGTLAAVVTNRASLEGLPLVTKEMIRDAGTAAQIRTGLVCNEVFTSGTTGAPLVTVRGNREQEFVSRFFQRIHQADMNGPMLRGLQINNPYHGYHVSVPAPIHFHRIGIYDSRSFEHGLRVLEEEHTDFGVEPRCTILLGLERCLRAFTRYAKISRADSVRSNLAFVISYSQLLTRRWNKTLQEFWGCPVIDRYSLAEVFGGASRCVRCGWWHFDPFIVPEVVGFRSGHVITEGLGILVVTSLYPFQEAQPIVRYITGDLVEVTHDRSCQSGVLAFRPLGRARYGVPAASGDGWILTPASVLEVIDAFPDVTRVPRFRDAEQVDDPHAVGHPKYRVSWSHHREVVRIEIKLQLTHKSSRQQQSSTADLIRQSLLSEAKELSDALSRNSASLDIKFVEDLTPDLIAHAE